MKLGLVVDGIGRRGRARIAERAARRAVSGVMQRIRARRSAEAARTDVEAEHDLSSGSNRT
jgi:hypothetical protein